jgi:hypothetical protein
MRLFVLAMGSVLSFLALADIASSEASDEATHARWAIETRCLDMNTAALPAVQRMCAEKALREVPGETWMYGGGSAIPAGNR